MPADVAVLAIGAGPTGLLLAGELARRGVECRLIEARPEPLAWDRATVIHPRSLEVFDALGIAEPFLAAGVPQRGARIYSDGELLGEIDLSLCGSRYAYNLGLSEQVTEAILLDHLHRHGGEVRRGTRLVELEPQPDGVLATLQRDGTSEQVRAQWVVGCDGLHSLTRERSGIDLVGHDIPSPWAVFDTTLARWPDGYDTNVVLLEQLPVILTALPGRRWRAYLRPSAPDSDLVADATGTLHRYHPDVAFAEVTDARRFHCHTRVAARYRAGRVLLAGDAAHVCSPAEGHGMNSGIQDAFNLAWKLALVATGVADPRLLDSYEAERRPVAERITASGDAAEGGQALTDPQQRAQRDAVLRRTFADPVTRHQEAIAEAELDIDYAGSPIVAAAEAIGLRAGQRIPDDITVRLATGQDAALHALAHRAGHTAVVLADGGLAQQIADAADPRLVEATVPAVARDGDAVLLVLRPDGHVGAIADRDHVRALAAYCARLA